jgi:hypothetical protein
MTGSEIFKTVYNLKTFTVVSKRFIKIAKEGSSMSYTCSTKKDIFGELGGFLAVIGQPTGFLGGWGERGEPFRSLRTTGLESS